MLTQGLRCVPGRYCVRLASVHTGSDVMDVHVYVLKDEGETHPWLWSTSRSERNAKGVKHHMRNSISLLLQITGWN